MEQPTPFDQRAEQAVLGSIFLNPEAAGVVSDWLEPSLFYLERHQWIFEAQMACFHKRVRPDLVKVCDQLRNTGRLESVGIGYVMQLGNAVPTATDIEHYAKIVERDGLLRRLIEAGGTIAQLGFSAKDAQEAIEVAEQTIKALDRRSSTDGPRHIRAICDRYLDWIEAVRTGRASGIGLKTGYRDLDEMTGGLQKSDLIIIAARPAVGKSSFALSIAYQAALVNDATVVYFTLEMSEEQLVQRMLAIRTGVDSMKLRKGDIRADDMYILTDAMGSVSNLNVFIDETPALKIGALQNRCHRLQAQHGLDLVIVDYLQLMKGPRSEGRVQEIGEISRGLKALAKELNIPVIALSQLNRAVEGRQSHVPMLSDLRESGDIEQDADIVMFIYREELYDPDTDKKGIAEIHIAKHRNGPVGVVPLRFFSGTTKFADLAGYREVEGYGPEDCDAYFERNGGRA